MEINWKYRNNTHRCEDDEQNCHSVHDCCRTIDISRLWYNKIFSTCIDEFSSTIFQGSHVCSYQQTLEHWKYCYDTCENVKMCSKYSPYKDNIRIPHMWESVDWVTWCLRLKPAKQSQREGFQLFLAPTTQFFAGEDIFGNGLIRTT